ncbi:MAG: GMP synthase [Anaerolineae bacterium]|nr:GMP synthase [Anaerolineales bacterium]
MKLAILNALPGPYIFEGEPSDGEKFVRLFGAIDPAITCQIYDATAGELPDTPAVADAFLITGSPAGVYDGEPWIAPLEEFVRQAYAGQKKLVGICFGHQLLAQALGGRVEKSEKGWVLGLRSFEIQHQADWLTPAASRCSLYFVNQDQVVALPPGAAVIGGNDFCPYTIYALKNQVLGIQAHIEQSRRFMRLVIDYLEPRAPAALRAEAHRSLEQALPDDRLVARWVVNFLMSFDDQIR